VAIGGYLPTLKKFPVLRDIQPDDWDFLVTVAVVFAGLEGLLSIGLSEPREREMWDVVLAALKKWNANCEAAFSDCQQFFYDSIGRHEEAGTDSLFVAADALGFWVVCQGLRRELESNDEMQLARGIGYASFLSVRDWWKNSN
jgi:hypothetical protein